MNKGIRFTDEFKQGAVAQVVEHGYAVSKTLRIELDDINDDVQILALAGRLNDVSADVVFANAGVSLGPDEKVQNVDRIDFVHLMITNAYSPMRTVECLDGRTKGDGVIAVMSSGLASVKNNGSGDWKVYRASKASLNTLMKSRAFTKADSRAYLCLALGWVQTDMGGDAAPLSVNSSVVGLGDTIIAQSQTAGVQFLDYEGNTVAW